MSDQQPAVPPIRRADEADRDELAAALTRAFADDPVIAWLFPDESSRAIRTERTFQIYLRDTLRVGEVFTTADRTGASMWKPPGKWKLEKLQLARQLPALAQAFGRRITALIQMENQVEALHPDEPHWYLAVLGTDPVAQGKGIGAALLRQVTDRCDANGEAAYLESSKPDNVPYYERFGFKVTGEVTLGKHNDGATMWMMWRDPQAPDS